MCVRISKIVKINVPLRVTFSKPIKSKSSKVCFTTFQGKENFELWALSFETAFENVTPSGIGCTLMIDNGSKNVSRSHLGWHFRMLFRAQSSKFELLFSLKRGKRDVRALRKWHPKWDWLYFYQFHWLKFLNSKIYCVLKCLCVVKSWRKCWMLDDVCKSVVFSVDITWVIARARLLPHALCPCFQVDWQ